MHDSPAITSIIGTITKIATAVSGSGSVGVVGGVTDGTGEAAVHSRETLYRDHNIIAKFQNSMD